MSAPVSSLAVLEPMLGTWEGDNRGAFGTAVLSRVAEYVLDGRFIRVTTRSVGERDVHEDIAFFSYDAEQQTIVLREFHSEGYVNRYTLTSSDPKELTFESEHIENPFDPTLRARTVIRLADPLVETLELATGGRPYETCVEATLRRTSDASSP